ncbi:hypothetical protein FEE96_03510 [Parasedimentitalea maritima]|uniref:Amidohydrolase-related domain-containing protein n=1 Tax=Parasedimentitalea maritima TaxID=2578117 RepID=A0ABY2V1W5_9RHOB|nr:hypothetical protein [Zongyanglinia marina]TLP69362.1 hypothetical protein FEE96_03510 [Zongyanglinia marina]
MTPELGIHFHVGPARITDGILNDRSIASIVKKANPSSYLVTNKEFKNSLRSSINAVSELDFRQSLHDPKTIGLLQRFENFQEIIFSQQAILGHPKSILNDSKILPGAEEKIGKITSIFAEHELTFHFTIANQYNYFRTLLDELGALELKKKISFQIPSWYEFFCRLLPHCDGANIVIWDFTLPNTLALPFVQSVLGLAPDQIPKDLQTKILENSCEHLKVSSIADRAVPIFTEEEGKLLSEMYRNDIINISNHPELTLIRPTKV